MISLCDGNYELLRHTHIFITHLVMLHLQLLPETSCWKSEGLVPTGHVAESVLHKSLQTDTFPKSGIELQVQFFFSIA